MGIRWQDNQGNIHESSIVDLVSTGGVAIPPQLVVIQWTLSAGAPATVANDIAPWYVLPSNVVLSSAFICAKTLPTVTNALTYDIKYSRANSAFASIFAAGSVLLNPGTLHSNAIAMPPGNLAVAAQTLLTSDILRVDCIAVGDTVAGQDITIQLIGTVVN